MANKEEKDIDRIFREGVLIDKAMAMAAKAAILQHKQKGQPLTVWRNGKTVLIPPEELDLESLPK
jgi:hypothetical protein